MLLKTQKPVYNLRKLSEPSSKELRKNLIAAGVKVPDFPNADHHIVAGKAPSVNFMEDMYESVDFRL